MKLLRSLAAFALVLALATAARAQTTPVVEEVEVKGRRTQKAGQTVMTGDEVRQVPGAFGDHFRAVEALPGVTPIASGVPFFFIRGAPPGNNGYYLDGVRIPVLYHVGLGPSVVHPGLVRRVDFYPGGYPARFGRFAGGILSGETRAPATELHGEGNIRIFDAGALVETPFGNGRGTALVAGRYSYTGAVLSLIAPEARLAYWDYQSRVTWALGPDDTIGFFAFGSYDFLGDAQRGRETKTIFASQFHRLDLRWDHRLPKGGSMRLAATIGSDETGTEEVQGVRDRMFSARLLIEQPAAKDVLVRGGMDTTFDHYDLADRELQQRSSSLYPPRNDVVVGAFLDTVLKLHPRWEVTPGIRMDLFGSVLAESPRPFPGAIGRRTATTDATTGAKVAVDPRLLSRLALSPKVTLVSTFGVVHQPPAFFIPIPGLSIGRLGQGLQHGAQASQGLEVALPEGFTLTPTLFYNHTIGLTDFLATCAEDGGDVNDFENDDDCVDRRVRGRTFGMELLLRRALTKKLTGWFAYTLSRTTRTVRRTGIAATIPGDFDRTHVINVIGAYDLGRNWRFGARFYFYSGRPYSPSYRGFPVPPFNSQRMNDFWRLDVRLEKGWHIGRTGRVSFVIEVLNATLNKEVFAVSCSSEAVPTEGDIRRQIREGRVPQESLDRCKQQDVGPITIPSIGVEGSF